MSNLALTLVLFAGIALLFAAGSIISHITMLERKYDEMMNTRGNVADLK